mmetsp:Transcript_20559/g.58111  ORF Transcript_20559/g.58111 Transcript_20559/m.58111 type:complete len:123 (-) Transcript_20559:12-380(-)
MQEVPAEVRAARARALSGAPDDDDNDNHHHHHDHHSRHDDDRGADHNDNDDDHNRGPARVVPQDVRAGGAVGEVQGRGVMQEALRGRGRALRREAVTARSPLFPVLRIAGPRRRKISCLPSC